MKDADAGFRKLAEQKIGNQTRSPRNLSEEESRCLIHELEVHQMELEMQNEELRKAQIQLEHSRAKYTDLYDFAPVAYFTFNQQGIISEVNLTGSKLINMPRKKLINYPFSRYLCNNDADVFYLHCREVLKSGSGQKCELQLKPRGGSSLCVQLDSIPVEKNHIRTTISDISQRKQAEEKMAAALKDKEVLLRELYHRTKNNMQVISSIISLRASFCRNQELEQILKEIKDRIRAMSLVHERLYQSNNLSSINMQDYIGDLAELVMQSHESIADRISLRLNIEPIYLMIDTAIPFGLVLTELISNAIKHGFPNFMQGEILIEFLQGDENYIHFHFSDNGIGVAKEFNFRSQQSLGMQTIVALMEEQMQAELSINCRNGMAWHFKFNTNLYTPRVTY